MATSTDLTESDTRWFAKDNDDDLTVARNRIASLLAVAYRRLVTMQRERDGRAISSIRELANTPRSSVHGDVP
jgi:hypothetical protein